jgi:5-methylcytosine-specific restriction enzyme subunit McrC
MKPDRRILTLTEHETRRFARHELPDDAARRIWRDFGSQVLVEPPSFQTDDCWQLTARDWVGFIPASPGLGLALQPKVPLRNLFRMVDYAYDLGALHFLADEHPVQSLPDLYARLAVQLARRTLERCRRGLHGAYLDRTARTGYVQGQLQMRQMANEPWQVALPCTYAEQTTDIPDNQIIAWTLHVILRSGLCHARALPPVQRAHRALLRAVTLQPWDAAACRHRTYSRLNRDYAPMHALCAFFLDHSGPSHVTGEESMSAFLVHMARLYEQFVAAWLARHLSPPHRIRTQEQVPLGVHAHVRFQADLVLYDGVSARAWAVMDTKYKIPERGPDTADVQQVLAYAHAVDAPRALLVYPATLAHPLDAEVNGIRVRSATFALDGDLEQQGHAFVETLGV